jgi:Nitroreductase
MNSTLETIASLRTTHGGFSGRELVESDLEAVLDAAVRAPTASARQPYSIVVMSDRAAMEGICGYSASRLLLFCVDYNRIADAAARLGHEFEPGGLTGFVTGSTDTILAAENAAIAARSLGIDTLFTNGIHRGDIDRVYRLARLPRRWCFPLIALLLGYADAPAGPLKGRLRGAGIVHREEYHRPSGEELGGIIAEYDDPERHMGLSEAWRAEGFEHYLDWFHERWQRIPAFRGPSAVLKALASSGFLTDRFPEGE